MSWVFVSPVGRRKVRARLAAALGLGLSASGALGASGTWNADASDSWGTASRWASSTIADGAGFTANFTFNITGDRTITLDQDRTIGNLTFTDSSTASNNWILAPGTGPFTLTLDVASGSSIINVTNQTATINAVLATADGDPVQKNGSGALVLGAQNLFSGGLTLNGGTTRFSTNSTVSGGAITGGALGTGTLTLTNSATLQDNGSARTLQNNFVLAGNGTINSSGSGSITFNSTGLSTPAGISITAAAPTLTVNNTTTFANVITSTGSLTKSGTGRLILSADNSSTWNGAASTLTVNGGVLELDSLTSAPRASGRSVVIAANGTLVPGTGVTVQDLLTRVDTASAGVIALGASSTEDIDLTTFANLRLGSTTAVTYTGALTPAAAGVYRLGGGGGTLTFAPLISGASQVNIGNNGSATGAVVLSNAANSFTGGILVDAGTLAIDTADPASGNSKLGAVPASPATNITLQNGGLIRYVNTAATLNVNRSILLGTGGGGIDTGGNNITFGSNSITGTTGFTKDGNGTLTMNVALPNGPVTARGGGTTAATASTLNMGGQDLNISTLLVNDQNNTSTSVAAVLTNVHDLTASGNVTIGNDGPGTLTIASGGSITLNNSAANFIVMNRPTSTNLNGTFTGTVNASAAASVSLNVNNFIISNGNAGASGNGIAGVMTMPTSASSTVSITTAATGAVDLGVLNNNGGNATLTLGGGTNTIRTNTMVVGAAKTTGTLTITPGGSLDIQGLSGGKVALNIADNAAGTGIGQDSKFDMTGGTIGSAAAHARFSAVNVALSTNGSGTGATTGRLIIDGASSFVDMDSVTLATGRSGNNSATTGILEINNGTVTMTAGGGGIQPGAANGATGSRTSTLTVAGGLLDMSGTDIGNITTMTFTGGTIRSAGNIARAVTQNGASANLDVLLNDMTITGGYTLAAGRTSILPGRTLGISGTLDLTSTTDTLRINDPSGTLLNGSNYTLETFGALASGAHYSTVEYFDGSNTFTYTDTQATTPGGMASGYSLQYGTNSLVLNAPEPGTVGLIGVAAGLLAFRRRRRRA